MILVAFFVGASSTTKSNVSLTDKVSLLVAVKVTMKVCLVFARRLIKSESSVTVSEASSKSTKFDPPVLLFSTSAVIDITSSSTSINLSARLNPSVVSASNWSNPRSCNGFSLLTMGASSTGATTTVICCSKEKSVSGFVAEMVTEACPNLFSCGIRFKLSPKELILASTILVPEIAVTRKDIVSLVPDKNIEDSANCCSTSSCRFIVS